MAKEKETKTNAMRILDQNGVVYKVHGYECDGFLEGTQVADLLHQDYRMVYKTLVAVGKSNQYYVFVIPVDCELDLKKAAKAISEKAITMLPAKELLQLTGYIHGGCSPIGMKKFFPTTFHNTAADFDTIMFSAGKVGYQVELPLKSLDKIIRYQLADIIVD